MPYLAVGYTVICNVKSFSREFLVLRCVTIQESILKTAKRELLAAIGSQKATSHLYTKKQDPHLHAKKQHCHLNVGIAIARLGASNLKIHCYSLDARERFQ